MTLKYEQLVASTYALFILAWQIERDLWKALSFTAAWVPSVQADETSFILSPFISQPGIEP